MKVKRVILGSLSVLAVFVLCFVLVSYPTFKAVCRNVASKIHKTFSPTYPGWGISLPDNYEVHGIDVSRHQREIDWNAVSATKNDNISISFAFIKATEGRTV